MSLDRETTLKTADKFIRQGRLDAAIAEYVRLLEDQPGDWSTANTLGDLYVRAGQNDRAAEQYMRIADQFFRDGVYAKASAFYKKVLKINRDHEAAQLQLAEIAAKQGLLVDARSYLNAVAKRRRDRGDHRGVAEVTTKLGSLDPADIDGRLLAARAAEELGDSVAAAERYKALHRDLLDKGREAEATDALHNAIRLNPRDAAARATLVREALARGEVDRARGLLDRAAVGDDPVLLFALFDLELQSGHVDQLRELLPSLLRSGPEGRSRIVERAWKVAGTNPDTVYVCVDAIVNHALSASDFTTAASALQDFAAKTPGCLPALSRLVEVCIAGKLESAMYAAQKQLADAYLDAGRAAEARPIAEVLLALEPWETSHIDRLRRVLVMLDVPDPDLLIAERLSGTTPFTATDPFVVAETPQEPPPGPAADTSSASPDSRSEPPPVRSTPAATRASVPATGVPADEIDLTDALGDLDIGEVHENADAGRSEALEKVFEQMRQEAQNKPDQATHDLTLARTYLELGMTDEALKSLQAAAESPIHRFESASLLGRLHKQHGDISRAIEWFERAADAAAPTPEDGRALLYELGVTLDDEGETTRALAVFLELQAQVGGYRDVSSRIDRLARAQAGG